MRKTLRFGCLGVVGLIGIGLGAAAFIFLGWAVAILTGVGLFFDLFGLRQRATALPPLAWGAGRRGLLAGGSFLLIGAVWFAAFAAAAHSGSSNQPRIASTSVTTVRVIDAHPSPSLTPVLLMPSPTPPATPTELPPTAALIPPSPTQAAPTPTPDPSAALAQIADQQFGARLRSANISNDAAFLATTTAAFDAASGVKSAISDATPTVMTDATVDYNLGTQWDENTAVSSAAQDFVSFAPHVFAATHVDMLELRAFTTFRDVYGHDNVEVATKFTISRATAERINWQNFDPHNIVLVLTGDSGVYIHPALQRAWLAFSH